MLFQSVANTIALACMASSAVASPLGHLHHMHKRDDVVVQTTVVVHVGGNSPVATASTAASADSVAAASAFATATETPAIISASVPASAPSASASSGSSDSGSSDSGSSGSGSFSGASKGITYSPYNSDGTCKDLSTVQSDLAKLSSYGLIRLYGVDCNQVENVLQAKADGQQLFLGIFFVDQLSQGIQTMASAISSYGSWSDVYTVSIGNELVNNGEASASQIGQYVSTAKSLLSSAGYSGPVVSVDTHVAIMNNPELCEYSDYIAFNAHAYWDGSVTGGEAGTWLLQQMQRVASACGKNVMCVETGWPHQGGNNGIAVASSSEQSAAISSIQSTCGNDVVVFNAFDDMWKNPGSNGVEQFWGIL
ncbi:hypothetical protein PMKS-003677 [Pichia membranifaciens]|uniref:Uncharacterized protein n=1 Tax=Pichia membranifaciens TaxID=4926 RepID=A0A1Q2YKW3_9ASCO|nr:hypothetical protein PMKS-003677 [Pichia membranifaciens]